jgi:Na+-translocating ferredoxin:NAD+ oxidoreductase subunit G
MSEQAPKTNSVAMIGTLSGVAAISGFLIVLAFQATAGRIAENKQRFLEKAIDKVIPNVAQRVPFAMEEDGFSRIEGDGPVTAPRVYAGYNEAGELMGVALEAAAQGYQDTVRILYGYAPGGACITGIYVLDSKETPGLGDKIGKDQDFLDNFRALDVQLDEAGTGLKNAIETVKHGTKTDPWQIDGITGATISSKAIGKMLNDSAQQKIPRIMKHLDQLRSGE